MKQRHLLSFLLATAFICFAGASFAEAPSGAPDSAQEQMDAGQVKDTTVPSRAANTAPAAHDDTAPAPAPAPAPTKQPSAQSKTSHSLTQLRSGDIQQSIGERLTGVFGCFVLLGLALLLSSHRSRVNWRLVGMGTLLQFIFALLVLKTSFGKRIFEVATTAVNGLLSFTTEGARFVFGNLVDMTVPVTTSSGGTTEFIAHTGSLIAFGVMPTILFFSALTAVLYHLGILQRVVQVMAWLMQKTMGTSGAESLSASANIFVGQTEAPLLVRPFLDKMTNSELMAVMTGGFATVAGGVMAVYVGMLRDHFPDIAGHLLAASIMSAPASLVMAKIILPETEEPETKAGAQVVVEQNDANMLDAIARGTSDGLSLALNVVAMLITFVAIVAMLNWGIGALAGVFGHPEMTLQKLLGYALAPLAWTLGVPSADAVTVGGMLGTKTVINEFVAYLDLSTALTNGTLHSPKSVVIAIYALCGFSNLGSIGIQIGGLSIMAPHRRADLARIGLKAMIAASLACFQTAALAGILL